MALPSLELNSLLEISGRLEKDYPISVRPKERQETFHLLSRTSGRHSTVPKNTNCGIAHTCT